MLNSLGSRVCDWVKGGRAKSSGSVSSGRALSTVLGNVRQHEFGPHKVFDGDGDKADVVNGISPAFNIVIRTKFWYVLVLLGQLVSEMVCV